MAIEEKLSIAIKFIKSIESMHVPALTLKQIVDSADVYCEECGDQCSIDISSPNDAYVDASIVYDLKDKAWHVLADITD